MKIKIAHITQSLGGVKTYIEGVVNNSDASKFEYVVIAPEHFELQEVCKMKNYQYFPIKIGRSINPFKDLSAILKTISILRSIRPDIVHTHSAKGGYIGRIAAKFCGIKVIYAPHAFSYLSFKGIKRTAFYLLECFAKRWTDVLLTLSYSEANRGIHEVGFDRKRVRTILNGVGVPDSLPFRNYISGTRIGMIGRLTHQKNPLLFLEIADNLLKKDPNLKFSILGAGICDHLTGEIDQFLTEKSLKDKISILEWGDNNTSRDFLLNIDIFVLTSVFEGLPFSLIEAMAMGIPSVVSKVDGNTDVIQNNENGYSCLTASEFEEKINLLINDETLRRKIGQEGYRYVKNHHEIQNTISLLEKEYLELISSEVGSNEISLELPEPIQAQLKVG